MPSPSLLSESYVLSRFAAEFERYLADQDQQILARLTTWTEITQFLRDLWGYVGPVESATGEYTLLDARNPTGVPQVIVQQRKGRSQLANGSPVRATWGIVTDMNEFRLYLRSLGESQCQRFVLRKLPGDLGPSLLDQGQAGAAQRFLFTLVFHRDMLISASGKSALEQLLEQQWTREKDLDESLYRDYSKLRERMYAALTASNPALQKVVVLRLSQRLIDRLVFLLFCDDLIRPLWAGASAHPDFGEDLWTRVAPLADRVLGVDPHLDGLRVPNLVFRALLEFSAGYSFGEIGVHTLGRIFEQSIADLEAMEALAGDQKPARRMSRRKREGVYYTPEWLTAYLVEETLGRKLEDIERDIGPLDSLPKLDQYAARVERLTVIDFACGAGAFLTPALRRLVRERRWIALERERITQEPSNFDHDSVVRETLSNNLFGLDINAESVQSTRLALRLHTAQPGAPFTSLDHNIRVGNSLILDWRAIFSGVFERGGFDCIIGNPPYVKYQHLRQTDGALAERLRAGTDREGRRMFASTSSGNFDLYIPFIEKGFELLHPEGRMGLIAPNLWIKQAYGEPLRRIVREGRHLQRWMDFGDFQVFEDATTYTSLQFYSKSPAPGIQYAQVRGRNLSEIVWDHDAIQYTELPTAGPWTLAAPEAMRLIRRLSGQFPALEATVESISVGVQTSADKIYHFTEAAPGRYRTESGIFAFEGHVRQLVSGADVRRFATPSTDRRILFPYVRVGDEVMLAPAAALEREAPTVWRYLRDHETQLRGRERGRFDDDGWYRFGRNQNIDKQHRPKLLIPRLVRQLGVTPDLHGDFVADNVDVCYLIPKRRADIWYLVGILNSSVADFVFKAISKPFRGGYWSANKQYVAPIPVPVPTPAQRRSVGQLAQALRKLCDAAREENRQSSTRQIQDKQAQLDQLAFELYGLTEPEAALIRD